MGAFWSALPEIIELTKIGLISYTSYNIISGIFSVREEIVGTFEFYLSCFIFVCAVYSLKK
jgi:hypothetical protein